MESLLSNSDAGKLLESLLTTSPVSIRANPKKKTDYHHLNSLVPWATDGFYLNDRPSFTLDPTFHAGAYYVQEASSMFLEQVIIASVDLKQPLKVLDLCAAPGGKSTQLLSLLSENSLLVSNEVIRSRAGILAENTIKWGNANCIVTSNDPKYFTDLMGYFDVVVLDAPCSGEGLFRKDNEAMKEWSLKNVELCSLRQQRILRDVIPALKQNGVLIYSTCTYNRKENEENIIRLISSGEFESIQIPIKKEWGIEEVNEHSFFGYRFYPHKTEGEGFFISALRKLSDEQPIKMKHTSKIKEDKGSKIVHQWIESPLAFHQLTRPEGIRIIPHHMRQDVEHLSKHLYIIQAGTLTGSIKHDKFIPNHSLALCNHLNQTNINSIELSLDEALQYLRMHNLSFQGPIGFALVTYKGLGLGWVNILANRINNMYPTSWRVRM